MLYAFSGNDRDKVRAAARKQADTLAGKSGSVLVLGDAHVRDDIATALQGPGMFSLSGQGERIVIFDSILSSKNEDLGALIRNALPMMSKSKEVYVLAEGALLAADRKLVEKHAEKSERFDTKSAKEYPTVFALADALARGDKKNLWIGLMSEYAKGNAPEAIHGVLFWGVKKMLASARDAASAARAKKLMLTLAALPHESRRKGEDLSYALERFALSL